MLPAVSVCMDCWKTIMDPSVYVLQLLLFFKVFSKYVKFW